MQEKATIGIDLGTSKCCVASVQNEKLTVLPNARGENTTPSFVAFNDQRCLVGSDAKEQAAVNPKNTVYGVKNILGRGFNDPVVQNYLRFSAVSVSNVRGQSAINVDYRDQPLSLSPLLIAAMQLLKMKQQAEEHVGEVGGAVVSVPAYFGNSQREAIVAACQIAGLELLDLISEPTATALTYRENRGSTSEQQTILVFDMGAAKLDVSVIRVSEEEVNVLAVCGNDALGGDYLSELLMLDVDDKFEEKHHLSLLDDERATLKLKAACEEIKKKLSLLPNHRIVLDSILDQKDLTTSVTRKRFEKLFAKKFLPSLKAILDAVLRSAEVCKSDIEEVVVVGGCSRVPLIEYILRRYFGLKDLNKTVNADESVATGAAMWAYELALPEQRRNFILKEMVRVPLMDCSRSAFEFHNYVPWHQGMRFSSAIERTLTDGSRERKQTCFTLDKFDMFKIKEVISTKPTNGNKEDKPIVIIDEKAIESSKNMLETFEQHRIKLENDEKAQNDLEGYCYTSMEKVESFKDCFSEIDKVFELSEIVAIRVERNEIATVEDCERERDALVETWKKCLENVMEKASSYLAEIEACKCRSDGIPEDIIPAEIENVEPEPTVKGNEAEESSKPIKKGRDDNEEEQMVKENRNVNKGQSEPEPCDSLARGQSPAGNNAQTTKQQETGNNAQTTKQQETGNNAQTTKQQETGNNAQTTKQQETGNNAQTTKQQETGNNNQASKQQEAQGYGPAHENVDKDSGLTNGPRTRPNGTCTAGNSMSTFRNSTCACSSTHFFRTLDISDYSSASSFKSAVNSPRSSGSDLNSLQEHQPPNTRDSRIGALTSSDSESSLKSDVSKSPSLDSGIYSSAQSKSSTPTTGEPLNFLSNPPFPDAKLPKASSGAFSTHDTSAEAHGVSSNEGTIGNESGSVNHTGVSTSIQGVSKNQELLKREDIDGKSLKCKVN